MLKFDGGRAAVSQLVPNVLFHRRLRAISVLSSPAPLRRVLARLGPKLGPRSTELGLAAVREPGLQSCVRDLFSIAGAAPSLLFSPENPLVRQVRCRQHDRLESKPVRARSRVSDIFLTHAVCRVEPGCRCAGPSPTGERRRELFPNPNPGAAQVLRAA